MARITRREAAMAWAMYHPDMPIPEQPKPRARMTHPEADLQKACIAWLRIRQRTHKDVRFIVAQSENMGKPTPQRMARRKAMGIAGNAGHAELILIRATEHKDSGLVPYYENRSVTFIEFKADAGRMSEAQLEWQYWLTVRGFDYWVIRTLDELVGLFA